MKKYIIVLIAMAILILCLCIYGWIRQAMDKKQAAVERKKELLHSGTSIFSYSGSRRVLLNLLTKMSFTV